MKKNFISVVIPAYNEETVIAKTINSVLGSTYKRYEIIVVNDGSTDRTRRIVETLIEKHPKKIRLINYDTGHSPAFARNRGAEAAKGDILFFLDADDWVGDDTLKNITKEFKKHNKIEFIVGIREPIIPKNWRRIFLYYWATMKAPALKEMKDYILTKGPYCPYIMRTKKFFIVGKFDENLYYNEDNEFRIRLIRMRIPKLFAKDVHFYTDMGCEKRDFIRRCKNTAKCSSKNISNLYKILIMLSISIMTFPVFYIFGFSYMFFKSRDMLISISAPFLYTLRRILDVYYFLKLNLGYR